MSLHRNMAEPSLRREIPEFVRRKSCLHRNRAVVDGDRIPPKKPGRSRKKMIGDRMALKIIHDHRHPGRLAKAAKQVDYAAIFEVVQEQGAVDEIEASRTTGKRKASAASLGCNARRR